MADGASGFDAVLSFEGCTTIGTLFRKRAQEHPNRTAHREKDLGIWRAYDWAQYWAHARWVGMGLRALGLGRGEVVSILSEDRKEWLYVDMAVVCMGGITSGVYTTDSASQLSYLVNDSQSRFLFLENDEQLDKWLEARDEMPSLEKVIVLDRDGLREFSDPKVIFFDDLIALGKDAAEREPDVFDAEIDAAEQDGIAMLIYTSGTTGPPKGAMLSHGNMIFQMVAALPVLEVDSEDEQLCFLPLCHILERVVSTYVQLSRSITINFSESAETVFENLQEVSPHTFVAVPRVWEKMYSRVQILRSEATGIGRWALDRAVAAGSKRLTLEEGGKAVPMGLRLQLQLWNLLVLRNLRRMLGMDRMRRGGSGAAPISPDLLRWFHAIGVPLYEGYGATETAGIATFNRRGENFLGSVGMPVPGTEIKIAEDGEILLRGQHIFKGYWKKPDKTAETLRDGWLHTGDVGRVGNDGSVTITGRLKDIIITQGGKNITPAEIESKLKFSPYVSDAVVIGDRRKYLTCLVMIDQENVEKFAQDLAVPFSDFASLCAAKEVQELVRGVVNAVNKDFARVEQIKDFRLIDILLTAEDDELTPTMKLKRSFVEQKHKALIDDMYAA